MEGKRAEPNIRASGAAAIVSVCISVSLRPIIERVPKVWVVWRFSKIVWFDVGLTQSSKPERARFPWREVFALDPERQENQPFTKSRRDGIIVHLSARHDLSVNSSGAHISFIAFECQVRGTGTEIAATIYRVEYIRRFPQD